MKGRRIFCLVLALGILLGGCGLTGQQRYTATFLDLFDTVTTVVAYGGSRQEFDRQAAAIHEALQHYHQLFDIYHDYPGINNLKIVNDRAGIAPVQVDSAIIDLLTDCKEYYMRTGGVVNCAMGSVLRLWHEARTAGLADPENARLPDRAALEAAAAHMDFEAVIIDAAASTVYITDSQLKLDVGAIAKGWATQRVAEQAAEGLLISVGGNVCATGPKGPEGSPWAIGIQNPEEDGYLHTVSLHRGSLVTSGDYQRSYRVDGIDYHHIIDPNTLMPAALWRSVTIACSDSGLGDALSTALFLLPLEEGKALLQACGAEAMWVDARGQEYFTPGFEQMLRS